MLHFAFFGNGRSYHVQKWLPALAEEGLRVSLVTFHPPSAPLPGVGLHVLDPPLSRHRDRMNWLDFWGPTRPLRRWLTAEKVDVLMASFATSYGLFGMRSGFHPQLLNTWTYDVADYPLHGWRRWLFRPVVNRVLRNADAILTDGAGLAEIVRTHYPFAADKVTPTFWGIRLADHTAPPTLGATTRAAYGIPAQAPVLISPRGVSALYHPDVLLDGLHQLLENHADAHVFVLTLGHERPAAIQARLDALDAHPRGHLIDRFLAKPEMVALWSAADVLVSIPPKDGISVSVLEGMYLGALPVVSDIPNNHTFLTEGESGFFVPEATAASLTDTLLCVLADLPAHQAQMVARNRRWVAEHAAVEQTARQVADLIRRLAERAAA